MLFRPQRGGLEESMAELVSIKTISEFIWHIRATFPEVPIDAQLSIEPYGDGPDERIGWKQTFIIIAEGFGPLGFTDSDKLEQD